MPLSTLSRDDQLIALHHLKNYRNAIRQIGDRANLSDIIDRRLVIRVEHAPTISREIVESMSRDFLARHFSDLDSSQEILITERSSLSGGARIFIGDDMIDLSFDRFVPQLMAV